MFKHALSATECSATPAADGSPQIRPEQDAPPRQPTPCCEALSGVLYLARRLHLTHGADDSGVRGTITTNAVGAVLAAIDECRARVRFAAGSAAESRSGNWSSAHRRNGTSISEQTGCSSGPTAPVRPHKLLLQRPLDGCGDADLARARRRFCEPSRYPAAKRLATGLNNTTSTARPTWEARRLSNTHQSTSWPMLAGLRVLGRQEQRDLPHEERHHDNQECDSLFERSGDPPRRRRVSQGPAGHALHRLGQPDL